MYKMTFKDVYSRASMVVLCVAVLLGESHGTRVPREATELEPGNWDSCKPGAKEPPTRVRTSDRVNVLRNYFATNHIEAYLIPSEDAHQSEYPSEHDKRRRYISGFSGSQGFAVVTVNKQALWTDSRYFLEAEDVLECTWILMRQREQGVPSMVDWVKAELKPSQRLGASPYLISAEKWKQYSKELAEANIILQPVNELIDMFWSHNRPAQPDTIINPLPLAFAGRSWEDKIVDVREEMKARGAQMLVSTSLDDNAWLFNLRAADIEYNPFFISYAIIEMDRVRLYLLDHARKLTAAPSDNMTTLTVSDHLNTGVDGSCVGKISQCVEVLPYNPEEIVKDIRASGMAASKVWLGLNCNYKIYFNIPEGKIIQDNTPMAMMKSKKNLVEQDGMRKAHLRDAVAVVTFMTWLQQAIEDGEKVTEVSAANKLDEYRSREQYNRGLSFATISSYGSNGAIVHYRPSPATDKTIEQDSMYLLDSGGQYLDGTTDVTRTFHFGEPTAYMKECYTRVLMGHIDLFQAIWPKGLLGREIDAYARGPLWQAGLIYRHGTGHGIGAYLSVHEAPVYMTKSTVPLDEFHFVSDEPGFYEDGQFGVRLENIVMVKNATTKYNFPNTQFLTFDHVTLVPYEPKLIDFSLLSEKQVTYLNDYNRLCRRKVGDELNKRGEKEALRWLYDKTEEIIIRQVSPTCGVSGASTISSIFSTICVLACLQVTYIMS